jgi:6-phosphogluconate dehydrogenase (decarboxylating)
VLDQPGSRHPGGGDTGQQDVDHAGSSGGLTGYERGLTLATGGRHHTGSRLADVTAGTPAAPGSRLTVTG